MLSTFYPPFSFGGDAVQVERLAHALVLRGHEVTVLHSPAAYRVLSGRTQMPVPAESGSGFRRVEVDGQAGRLSPVATFLTGRPTLNRRALEHALKSDFDVLHFHNPSLLGGPDALRLGSAIKLYTAHEMWLICPTHVLWKYQRRVCERPTCWRCGLTYRRPPQLWRSTDLIARSLAKLDALITPSRTSQRLHDRLSPLVRIVRIPHFVPDAAPAPAQTDPARPYFLYVGRLEPIKGVETVIRAFARRRGPELVIAGTGSSKPALLRAAAGVEHIRFLDWQPEEALDRLYRGARAVVVPTRGHEAFGLVAVEGFARGTPTIAHDFGALAELLEESGGGLGFRTDADLQSALDALERDDQLRDTLGARGLSTQRSHWNAETHLAAYFQLIAEIARSRGDSTVAAIAESEAEACRVGQPAIS